MEIGKIRTEFWRSSIIWAGSIVLFFWSIASLSPQNNIKIIGNLGGWVAFASFIVGVISFFIGINALITIAIDINKLRRYSFLSWIGTIIFFIVLIANGPMLWGTETNFTNVFFGTIFIADIMLGIASFFVLIASYSSSSKVKDTPTIHTLSKKTYAKTTLTSKFVDELDDIIFTPQKKGGLGGNIVVIAILFLIAIIFIIPGDKATNTGTTPLPSTTSTLSQLTIVEPKITGNNAQRFQGTIRNASSNLATKVIMRVDFSKDKEAKQPFDTRYFTVEYVAANGAYSFDLPFDLNYTGQYWWNSKVETAEFK